MENLNGLDKNVSDTRAQSADKAYRVFGYVALALVSVMLAGHAFYYFCHPSLTYGDQAIYIESARLILEGKAPYVQFWDWNPPLIMYLNVLPVAISGLFGGNLILSFNIFVLFLCFLGAALAVQLEQRYAPRREFVFFLPVVLVAVAFTCLSTISYGEREHLFVLAFLPYFVLRSLRWRGRSPARRISINTGLLAGLMLCLKPQFFIAAAAMELALWRYYAPAKERLISVFWSFENKTILAVALAYGLALLGLPQGSRDVFFGEILPFYGPGYEFSQRSLMYMLRGDDQILRPVLFSFVGMLAAFVCYTWSPRIAALGAFCAVGLFNYFYGNQAWIYRLVPAEFAALLIFAEIAMTGVRRYLVMQGKTRAPGHQAVLLLLTALGTLYFCANDIVESGVKYRAAGAEQKIRQDKYPDMDALAKVIAGSTTSTDSVLYLGTGISPGYPAILQARRSPAARYMYSVLPQIEACTINHKEQKWKDLLQTHVSNYRADIQNNKPALIILQSIPIIGILEKEGLMSEIRANYKEMDGQKLEGLTLLKRL